MNKIIYLLVTLIIITGGIYSFVKNNLIIDKENIFVPINYTLDKYTIENVSNISCTKSSQCSTPGEYLVRSNCPYTSLCINNKCNVVCPAYKEPIIGGEKDIHGCLGPAGYSWCEVKNKCLRVWEEKCEVSTNNTDVSTKISICEQKGGIWYQNEGLCEVNPLSESECKAQNGEFNECASACRHDPKAEVCTMQCVLTCTFR